MSKKIIFNEDALLKLYYGVEKLAKAVKATLGPMGRYVAIAQQVGPPLITKDGVTVAEHFQLDDAFENEGVQLVREVCRRTEKEAGDGTTTSIVLTEGILKAGIKYVVAGVPPDDFVRGLQTAYELVAQELFLQARPVSPDMCSQIATIAANGDQQIGLLIGDLFKQDNQIAITVKSSSGSKDETELFDGLEVPGGFCSREFITDQERQQARMQDALLLLWDDEIKSAEELRPLVELATASHQRLCILCAGMTEAVANMLALSNRKQAADCLAIKLSGNILERASWFNDIALLTGARVCSTKKGDSLKSVDLSVLRRIAEVEATDERALIQLIKKENTSRDQAIQAEMEKLINVWSLEEKTLIEKRITRLKARVAVLHITAPTASELLEKSYRVEDAINSVKGALDDGIVPGGGVAYLNCIPVLTAAMEVLEDGERLGVQTIREVLAAPFSQILENGGEEAASWIGKVGRQFGDLGYNIQTRSLEEFYTSGIIDPVKSIRLALLNAISVNAEMLLIKCAITEDQE